MRDYRRELRSCARKLAAVGARPLEARNARKCFLHGFSGSQQGEVAAETSRHLQPEWQAGVVASAGNSDGRVAGQGNVVGECQPVVVVAQGLALHLREIELGPRPWR